jgi:transcriptional regulator with XRE-family HTH domain
MSFGKNLKLLRVKNGLTQKELAEKLSISTVTVIAYEQGHKKPSYEVLFSIAETLNASIDSLCDVRPKIRTWADAMQAVVALSACGPFVQYDTESSSLVLHERIIDKGEDGFQGIGDEPEHGYDSIENQLATFVKEFAKMQDLYYAGSIDAELFQMWLDKTYKKHEKPMPYTVPLIYYEEEEEEEEKEKEGEGNDEKEG